MDFFCQLGVHCIEALRLVFMEASQIWWVHKRLPNSQKYNWDPSGSQHGRVVCGDKYLDSSSNCTVHNGSRVYSVSQSSLRCHGYFCRKYQQNYTVHNWFSKNIFLIQTDFYNQRASMSCKTHVNQDNSTYDTHTKKKTYSRTSLDMPL